MHNGAAEGGNRSLVGRHDIREAVRLLRSRTAFFVEGLRRGHERIACPLTGTRSARNSATGIRSNRAAMGSLGPVNFLASASTLLIPENPSTASMAFHAWPDGHRLPLSVARPNSRPQATMTASRPLIRANATISFRWAPVT